MSAPKPPPRRRNSGTMLTSRRIALAVVLAAGTVAVVAVAMNPRESSPPVIQVHQATVRHAVMNDESRPLAQLGRLAKAGSDWGAHPEPGDAPAHGMSPPDSNAEPDDDTTDVPPLLEAPVAGASVEQRTQGTRNPLPALASFDGLGAGFSGPQGTGRFN